MTKYTFSYVKALPLPQQDKGLGSVALLIT